MRSLFLVFFLFLSGTFAWGDYLTPQEAGFRNCALIYYNENYDAKEFQPLLVKCEKGQPTQQAGYDAYLFLLYTVNGKDTLTGKTELEDWREQLAIYFQRKINVPSLNQAVGTLRKGKFLSSEPIQVMFSIPWLHPEVHDFGDVNGDGKTEDLSTEAGQRAVLRWYIQAVCEEMKKYPELKLWGFYMMNEGLSQKYWEMCRRECEEIHAQGGKALWIPYYGAAGIDMAYELGFDAVIMQSNWTFRTQTDGTGARRNRLVNSARFAKDHHFGIELEINTSEENRWLDIFAKSLETGTQTGFQQAASATYFGHDFFWPRGQKQQSRKLYALWMDYLAGKPVRLPERGTWKETRRTTDTLEIQYDSREPTEARRIDLFCEGLTSDNFVVLTTVEGRGDKTEPWQTLGWRIQSLPKAPAIEQSVLTTTFQPATLREMRVRMRAFSGNFPKKIVSLEWDDSALDCRRTQSFQKPYTTSKASATPQYPDETGRKLFDGVKGGAWKNHVGWGFVPTPTVAVDFGGVVEFDEVRVYLHEEPSAAIHLPDTIEAVYSMSPGVQKNAGVGEVPEGLEFACDFQYDAVGKYSAMTFSKPRKARAMTLRFEEQAWLFMSEIEFLKDGKRIPTDAFTRTLSQQDRLASDTKKKYSDDGKILTDGYICHSFNSGCVGVCNGEKLRATVDLEKVLPVKKVTAYLLDGGVGGVRMPKSGTLRLSNDGKQWSDPVPFPLPPTEKQTNRAIPVSVTLENRSARFVEVEFSSGSWTFLTEITVE